MQIPLVLAVLAVMAPAAHAQFGGGGPRIETPTFRGSAPTEKDCAAFGEAVAGIGDFTNYAYSTLHGVFIHDQYQNAEEASAKAEGSIAAGEGCGELRMAGISVRMDYRIQSAFASAAQEACANGVPKLGKKDCLDVMTKWLATDDHHRGPDGALNRYLATVDEGRHQCLSADDRAFLERMRLRPCQRGTSLADSNRCASARYGLADARIRQLGQIRGVLGKIDPRSSLGSAAAIASKHVASAQALLTALVADPARDNIALFTATTEVFGVRKMLDAGKRYCR